MKILITGINGFLGRNLIKEFQDHSIFGLDIDSGKIDDIDVFASKDLDSIKLNLDYIIMCHAAVASGSTTVANETLFEVNVKLTEQIVNKFQYTPIVYISTATIFDNDRVVNEKSKEKPKNNYAISKLWAESIVLETKRATVLRLSSLYGIGMKENTLIPNYVNQAIENQVIEVWGDGKRKQNYVNVEDIGIAIKKVVQKKDLIFGKILLGVSNKEYSNLEIAKIISKKITSKIKHINVDNSKSFEYDNRFTTEILNWRPMDNIESKLNEYIQWKLKK